MRALVTAINVKNSYRGGTFRYIFFKELDYKNKPAGRSFKTCAGAEFRNYDNWARVTVGMILENLIVKVGNLIDADSEFIIAGDKDKNARPADPLKCFAVRVTGTNNYRIYVDNRLTQHANPFLMTQQEAEDTKKRWDEDFDPAGEIIKI